MIYFCRRSVRDTPDVCEWCPSLFWRDLDIGSMESRYWSTRLGKQVGALHIKISSTLQQERFLKIVCGGGDRGLRYSGLHYYTSLFTIEITIIIIWIVAQYQQDWNFQVNLSSFRIGEESASKLGLSFIKQIDNLCQEEFQINMKWQVTKTVLLLSFVNNITRAKRYAGF